MALSRKERGPGVAGRCCARERVVLCARVRIGQETGSMRCTCINSLHNVFSHSAVLAGDGSGEMPISESESVLLIFVRFGCRLGAEISESESVLLIFGCRLGAEISESESVLLIFGCRLGAEISESESVLLIFVRFGCRLGAEISEPESVVRKYP